MNRNKTFLSDSHSEFGYVSWYVQHGRDYLDSEHPPNYTSAELRIADCSKSICLDFYSDGKKNHGKRVDKLDRLINELLIFRKEYVDSFGKRDKPMRYF